MLEQATNAPRNYEWTVDVIGELRRLGVQKLTPELERLLPLGPVVVWAVDMHREPTVPEIMERWSVCKATAYRWLSTLRRARAELSRRVTSVARCDTPAGGA